MAAGVLGVALPMVLGATGAEAAGVLHPDRASQPGVAPMPRSEVALPAGIEDLSPYEPQVSCDPHVKPGVKAFEDFVLTTWHRGFSGGAVRECSKGATSEHKEGRAWDWMLNPNSYADVVAGQRVIDWLLSDDATIARRLGLMYVIWNQRIWSAHKLDEGWNGYHGESDHTDHIHFSFDWAGAEKRTSWWTGKVAPMEYGPCRKYLGEPVPAYGDTINLKPCPKPVHKPKHKHKHEPQVEEPTTPTNAQPMPDDSTRHGPANTAPGNSSQNNQPAQDDPDDAATSPQDAPGPDDEIETDPDSMISPREETMPKHEPMPAAREPNSARMVQEEARRDGRPSR
jgi:hypothetical protein